MKNFHCSENGIGACRLDLPDVAGDNRAGADGSAVWVGADEAEIESIIMVRACRDRWSCGWLVVRMSLCWLMLVSGQSLAGQEPDPEDARAGLRTVVYGSEQQTVHGTAERPVFRADGGLPEVRGGVGQRMEYSGSLLVRNPGRIRFSAKLAGRLELLVDGRSVLSGQSAGLLLVGDPVELSGGDHEFLVRYWRVEGVVAGELSIFWSGDDFTLEPLPADVFSHFPQSGEADLSVLSAGREVTDALRCGACHEGWGEADPLRAPDLASALPYLSDGEVVRRLMSGEGNHAMPHFGLTEEQSVSAAAWLRSVTGPVAGPLPATGVKKGDREAGERLLLTLGCVACHQVSTEGEAVREWYGGPALIAGRSGRSRGWLEEWLKSPDKLNAAHRMPVFSLTDDERRQLALVLSAEAEAEAGGGVGGAARGGDSVVVSEPDRSVLETGRGIVEGARCASCHRIPGLESPQRLNFAAGERATAAAVAGRSCVNPVAEKSGRGARPQFRVSGDVSEAVRMWLGTIRVPLHPAGPRDSAAGLLLLRRNGCVACHDRDGVSGLSARAAEIEGRREDLRGQSEYLIPPALTAVGDRLRDEVLLETIEGRSVERRLPWLLVRMPRFPLTDSEAAAMAGGMIAEDRIPDEADSLRADLFEHLNPQHPALATSEQLVSGTQMAGAAGFNCIACHRAGKFEPRNVAPGTRGSDLLVMGRRLRSRYFMRWMQNPIRVLPGIEMPAIRRPLERDPAESLNQQFAVLWTALADPGFVPPTVSSRYEQVLTVGRGEGPRVLRDVFLAEGAAGGSGTARAFAVGFGNGFSVLLDADSGQLQQLAFGEFARQRTEGKSWFWDLAGIPLLSRSEDAVFCRLLDAAGTGEPLLPVRDERRTAELLSWRVRGRVVELRLRFHFGRIPAVAETLLPHSEQTIWSLLEQHEVVELTMELSAIEGGGAGVQLQVVGSSIPSGRVLELSGWGADRRGERIRLNSAVVAERRSAGGWPQLVQGAAVGWRLGLEQELPQPLPLPVIPPLLTREEELRSVPGFGGQRLSLPAGIMPTALAWLPDGRLALTSLKGQVWVLSDSDGDGLPDSPVLFAEGLAAPYGVVADGNDLLVSHKPEVLRLRDRDADGRADEFTVLAAGWGYSDDYHDWTAGLVRDSRGDLYVGLGSDYSQKGRAADNDRWRGTVLRLDASGRIEPFAYSMRFPMGLAVDDRDRLFATDNQGVQNTWNELNHLQRGRHYGVPSRHDTAAGVVAESPALMIPHPWTRSVNAVAFFPRDYPVRDLAGQGVGCEYDTQCLIRFSLQEVDGVMQGACYRFSRLPGAGEQSELLGPIACGFSADGGLWIGSIRDSGWQGAGNTGCLEVLRPTGGRLNGIREIRAVSGGFEVDFFERLPGGIGGRPEDWDVQSATRVWKGSYATADSERRQVRVTGVELRDDGRSLLLRTGEHQSGHLYEIRLSQESATVRQFWPVEGFYSMKRVPVR